MSKAGDSLRSRMSVENFSRADMQRCSRLKSGGNSFPHCHPVTLGFCPAPITADSRLTKHRRRNGRRQRLIHRRPHREAAFLPGCGGGGCWQRGGEGRANAARAAPLGERGLGGGGCSPCRPHPAPSRRVRRVPGLSQPLPPAAAEPRCAALELLHLSSLLSGDKPQPAPGERIM